MANSVRLSEERMRERRRMVYRRRIGASRRRQGIGGEWLFHRQHELEDRLLSMRYGVTDSELDVLVRMFYRERMDIL